MTDAATTADDAARPARVSAELFAVVRSAQPESGSAARASATRSRSPSRQGHARSTRCSASAVGADCAGRARVVVGLRWSSRARPGRRRRDARGAGAFARRRRRRHRSTRSRTSCSGSRGSSSATPSCATALTDRGLSVDDRKVALLSGCSAARPARTTVALVERVVTAPRGRTLEHGAGRAGRRGRCRDRERLIARGHRRGPLDEDQQERLASAPWARRSAATCGSRSRSTPTVVGGIVVRVGDEVIDGSVSRRLTRPRAGVAASMTTCTHLRRTTPRAPRADQKDTNR